MVCRFSQQLKLPCSQQGTDFPWFAYSAVLVKEILVPEWTEIKEPLGIGGGGLARSAPADYNLAAECSALEQDITMFTGKIVIESFVGTIRPQSEFRPFIEVKELKGIDQCRLPPVVVADDLDGAVERHLG